MLYCPNPKCAGRSQVVDTRYSPKANPPFVRRSRACMKCKLRWSTVELAAGKASHARKRTSKSGRHRAPLQSVIRTEEYLVIARELRALASRVAKGEIT